MLSEEERNQFYQWLESHDERGLWVNYNSQLKAGQTSKQYVEWLGDQFIQRAADGHQGA